MGSATGAVCGDAQPRNAVVRWPAFVRCVSAAELERGTCQHGTLPFASMPMPERCSHRGIQLGAIGQIFGRTKTKRSTSFAPPVPRAQPPVDSGDCGKHTRPGCGVFLSSSWSGVNEVFTEFRRNSSTITLGAVGCVPCLHYNDSRRSSFQRPGRGNILPFVRENLDFEYRSKRAADQQ